MHTNRIALSTVLAVSLIAAVPASGHTLGGRLWFKPPHHHHHRHRPRRHHRLVPTARFAIGMGNVQTLTCANLPLEGTRFVRIVVGYHDTATRLLPCAEAARNARLPVLLVIQWSNGWTPERIRQRFADALAAYQPVQPFAVGIGNEQEGPWNDGPQETGAHYASLWRTLEPMVAAAFPHAIRVAGEISPWGNPFMRAALAAGLPGAQAIAVHAYPAASNPEGWLTLQFAIFAQQYGLQAWADEGLCGPRAWVAYGCTPAREFRQDGYSLAAEWYDATPLGAPAAPSIPYY